MSTKLEFDITNDDIVLRQFRQMSKNDLEFSAIKRDDLIQCIKDREKYEKRLTSILVLESIKVFIGILLVITLIIKL